MANALDILINIQQKLSGDDALSKLKALDKQIKQEQSTLAGLEKQMAKMQAGPSIDIKKYEALSGKIAASKDKLGELGGAFEALGGKGAMAESALEKMGSAAGALGPIAGIIMGIVGAVTVLTVALGAAAAKLTEFALQAANAHRSLLLVLGALSGGASAGKANAEAIDRVAASSAVAKEEVEAIGKRLAIAGLSGKLYEDTLRTVAQATALLGAEAGGHIEAILEKSKALGHFQFSDKQLKGLGISFGDLAKQMGMSEAAFKAAMKAGKITVEQGMEAINKAMAKRFGGDSAAMMLDFGVQIMKLKENLTALFKDIAIEPFLKALHNLLSIFDSSTASGKAMHAMVKAIFDQVFAWGAAALPLAKEALIGFLIVMIKTYLMARDLGKAIDKAFGGDGTDKAKNMAMALEIGKAAAVLLIAALAALAVVLAPVVSYAMQVYDIFLLVVSIFDSASTAAGGLSASLSSALDVQLPDLGGAAGNMIDGLLDGIRGKLGEVAAEMANLGATARSALENALGIRSPSTVMAKLGGHTGEGFAQGVEDTEDRAQGAMQKIAQPPAAGAAKGAARGGASRERPTFSFVDCTFGSVTREQIEEWMADVLESHTIEAGAGAEPEPA